MVGLGRTVGRLSERAVGRAGRMIRPAGQLAAGFLVVVLAGCTGPLPPESRVSELASLSYPEEAEVGPDLDVLVRREGGRIRLVNREARAMEGGQLWLNRQYVGAIGRIEVGSGNVFELRRAVNRYHEAFPVGWLLAPDEARHVFLAELYDPADEIRYRLIVDRPRR